MGILITIIVFIAVLLGLQRSLGVGLSILFIVGYFYGILRANIPSAYFSFDVALLALYLFGLLKGVYQSPRVGWVNIWLVCAVLWATLVLVIPQQHYLIQLVGWRSAIWLPLAIPFGALCKEQDLNILGKTLVVLTCIAFGFALMEFYFGLHLFYPKTASTELIYRSLADQKNLRIPAIFSSAHHYGGTMFASIPIILRLAVHPKISFSWRMSAFFAMAIASIGTFLSAARSPVILLLIAAALLVIWMRPSLKQLLGLLILVTITVLVVSSNARFRRFETLKDTEMVQARLQGSNNKDIIDVFIHYPMGAGLGSAFGTSIPSFLMEYAPKEVIGAENEYVRIVIELGIPGLFLWLILIFKSAMHIPKASQRVTLLVNRALYLTVILSWLTGLTGAGLFASIPGSLFLMLHTGILSRKNQSFGL
jgi:hypothetical protein